MSLLRYAVLAGGLALAAGPAQAQGLAQCTVGQVVASPAGYANKYLQSVVIAVTPGHPFPCRVHPLGYPSTMEESFKPAMLRAPASQPTEPVGGVADDPHLLAFKGQKPLKASHVAAGAYECWGAGSGGQLSARMALNFTILDGSRYRDWGGNGGSYSFDAGSGTVTFKGAALDGQRGLYKQAVDPPTKSKPAQVFFQPSGDGCDWVSG
jgi:hypothetical protein